MWRKRRRWSFLESVHIASAAVGPRPHPADPEETGRSTAWTRSPRSSESPSCSSSSAAARYKSEAFRRATDVVRAVEGPRPSWRRWPTRARSRRLDGIGGRRPRRSSRSPRRRRRSARSRHGRRAGRAADTEALTPTRSPSGQSCRAIATATRSGPSGALIRDMAVAAATSATVPRHGRTTAAADDRARADRGTAPPSSSTRSRPERRAARRARRRRRQRTLEAPDGTAPR